MLFDTERNQLRQVFFDTWQHYKNKQTLSPLEMQLCDIILAHPEYHSILDQPERYLEQDYPAVEGAPNPFFHLALHMSILEQINTDRPAGIRTIYQKLALQLNNHQLAEHRMMDCLAEMLWQMQKNNMPVSETDYLQQLSLLLNDK